MTVGRIVMTGGKPRAKVFEFVGQFNYRTGAVATGLGTAAAD
jgi:hypothetical protein